MMESRIELIQGDITLLNATVIVNAANNSLLNVESWEVAEPEMQKLLEDIICRPNGFSILLDRSGEEEIMKKSVCCPIVIETA
jgi:hypothetical protein